MLRTAIIRNLRPTTLLLNKQPHSKWNALDRLLLRAYQIFEDENSNEHGLPMWLTRSIDPEIMFVVEEREDRAAAALQEWDEKQPTDPKKRKKGMTRYVVPYMTEGEPLQYGGVTRQQFRQAAIQEEQDRQEGLDLERDRPESGYDPTQYGDGLTDLP